MTRFAIALISLLLLAPLGLASPAVSAEAQGAQALPAGITKVKVMLRKPADISKISHLPKGYRALIKRRLAKRTPGCSYGIYVAVDYWDRANGFISGGVTECGGARVLWKKTDRGWRHVLGYQDIPSCRALRRREVPPRLWQVAGGGTCWAGDRGEVPYTAGSSRRV